MHITILEIVIVTCETQHKQTVHEISATCPFYLIMRSKVWLMVIKGIWVLYPTASVVSYMDLQHVLVLYTSVGGSIFAAAIICATVFVIVR